MGGASPDPRPGTPNSRLGPPLLPPPPPPLNHRLLFCFLGHLPLSAPIGPTAQPRRPSSLSPGPHTLTLSGTLLSGLGESQYIGVAYVDDTEIVRYDTNTPNARVQPRVPWLESPWVEQEYPDMWEEQKRICKQCEQICRAKLNNLRHYYNQSEDGEPRAPGCRHSPHAHGPAGVSPNLRVRTSPGAAGSALGPSREEPAGILTQSYFHSVYV